MSTKYLKKIFVLFSCSMLLLMAGCKGSGSKTYEGANLKFDIPSSKWEITYRVVYE